MFCLYRKFTTILLLKRKMKVNRDIQNLHTDVEKRENLEQKALGKRYSKIFFKLCVAFNIRRLYIVMTFMSLLSFSYIGEFKI